jgi:hypothetical protein
MRSDMAFVMPWKSMEELEDFLINARQCRYKTGNLK